MKTLKLFSDKERDYHAYQARQNYLREQRSIQIEREEDLREMERIKLENERIEHDMEQAQQDLQRERMEKRAALQREEAALHREQSMQEEIERLKALLLSPSNNRIKSQVGKAEPWTGPAGCCRTNRFHSADHEAGWSTRNWRDGICKPVRLQGQNRFVGFLRRD